MYVKHLYSLVVYLQSLGQDVTQCHISLNHRLVHDVLQKLLQTGLDGISVRYKHLDIGVHVGHQLNFSQLLT